MSALLGYCYLDLDVLDYIDIEPVVDHSYTGRIGTEPTLLGDCLLSLSVLNNINDVIVCQIGKATDTAILDVCALGATRLSLQTTQSALYDICTGTFHLTLNGQGDVSTLSFEIQESFYHQPRVEDVCVLGFGSIRQPIFSGYLTKVTRSHVSPGIYRYSCEAESFLQEFSHYFINKTYREMYAQDIVADILHTYGPQYQFLRLASEKGHYFKEYVCAYATVLDALQELAKLSGYTFDIDASRIAYFHEKVESLAPFIVDDNWEALIALPEIEEDSSELKNQIIVQYSELRQIHEVFYGDFDTKEFKLAYPVYEAITFTFNGEPLTYGSKYQEDNADNDASIHYTEGTITFNSQVSDIDRIDLTYYAQIPAEFIMNDTHSQLEFADRNGSLGIYSAIVDERETITSFATARNRALTELENYRIPYRAATYTYVTTLYAFEQQPLFPGMRQTIVLKPSEYYTETKVPTPVIVPIQEAAILDVCYLDITRIGLLNSPLAIANIETITWASPEEAVELDITSVEITKRGWNTFMEFEVTVKLEDRRKTLTTFMKDIYSADKEYYAPKIRALENI